MSAFGNAFTKADAAGKVARRLYNLEYRWNRRFRLWEHPDDPAIEARAQRLVARQRAARAAAEDAGWRLSLEWDRLSQQLPPAAIRTDADAYLSDTGREGAADLFGKLVVEGVIADPGTEFCPKRHDMRIAIDSLLLRRLRSAIGSLL
jgi:hypothetical protein